MSGVELTESGLARFDEVAAEHVGDDLVPGLVALVAAGEREHVTTLGSLSIGGPPVRRDSLFRIASTTKPITGAVTMSLVDAGLLTLDEPVDRLLPELANPRVLRSMDGPLDDTVPAKRPITVADLLTFRPGIGMHIDMFTAPEPWPIVAADAERGIGYIGPPEPRAKPDPDTWIARLGELPLLAQPGERWLYNAGALILGVLVERAAGAAFADVLRERICAPLGMTDTAFWTTRTDRLGTEYRNTPDGLVVVDPPEGQWSTRPRLCDGAAGLLSTVDDLWAFARMLSRGGSPVLSAGSVAAMTTNQITAAQAADGTGFLNGLGWGYCQAVATDGPRAGSFGWDGGLGTSWLVDPVRELTVIVLTQRMFDGPAMPAVHTDLRNAAYAALSPVPA